MKRLLCVLGIGTGALFVGCAEDPTGPTTGSITLQLVSPPAGTSADSPARAAAEPANHLQSLRVTLDGPTPKTQTFQCTTSSCEGTVEALAPGSYSVIVEGLVGTEVDHFGQTGGVTVTAGATAQATINFLPFQPVLTDFAADTTEVLHFTVAFSAVAAATSYVLQVATAPDFSGATSQTLTGTSTEVTVPAEGQYFVRVRAVNNVVAAAGRTSAPKSIVALQGVATVTVTPGTPTIVDGATQQFTAEGRDGDNNVVSSISFFWSSSDHSVVTVNQSGLATAVGIGQATITAVGKGQPGSAAVTVTFGPASALEFVTPPGDAEPEGPMDPAIEVAVVDARGNLVANAALDVTIAIGDDPSDGAATLSGTLTVTSNQGIATFSDLSIDIAGDGYTLIASGTSLADANTDDFDVFLAFVSVTTAHFHSCGLTTAGSAYCWGFGGDGQLGDGTGFSNGIPRRVIGNHTFAQVSAGGRFTCGLRTDGDALCWGTGGSGQLGNNGTSNVLEPDLVLGGHSFIAISAGDSHTCGVRGDGIVLCWGNAGNGRLGNNTTTPNALVPVVTSGGEVFASVSAGNVHTCGVRASDGRVLCWGAAANGRLGNNTITPDILVPSLTTNTSAFSSVSAGSGSSSAHTCGVRVFDGAALCWGQGANGRVGDNNAAAHDVLNPSVVVGGVRFATASAGPLQSCGLTTSGQAMCWGSSNSGSLGNGTTSGDFPAPVAVLGGRVFTSLEVNHNVFGSVCGTALDGTFCWGFNGDGQLGDGTNAIASIPVQVIGTR